MDFGFCFVLILLALNFIFDVFFSVQLHELICKLLCRILCVSTDEMMLDL